MIAWLKGAGKWLLLALGVLLAIAIPGIGWAVTRRKLAATRSELDAERQERERLAAGVKLLREAHAATAVEADKEREISEELRARLAEIRIDGERTRQRYSELRSEMERRIGLEETSKLWSETFGG